MNALIIGGTGMLADLVERLTNDFDVVGVQGRTDGKLTALARRSQKIVPIQADYTEVTAFEATLTAFTTTDGKPSLIVSWVHSTSPGITVLVAGLGTGDFYEVTGSSGRETSHASHSHEQQITAKGITYHRVILGSIGDRWLTNKEISQGVWEAIQQEKPEYIVGS